MLKQRLRSSAGYVRVNRRDEREAYLGRRTNPENIRMFSEVAKGTVLATPYKMDVKAVECQLIND